MATGVTITGSMLSASIASLESKLAEAQRKSVGSDSEDFFEIASIKNDIDAAQYEVELAGLTAAEEMKKEQEKIALHYTSIELQHHYNHIMEHGITQHSDVYVMSEYLERTYGRPEDVPADVRSQAVATLMEGINNGTVDPSKVPDYMVELTMIEARDKLKRNEEAYASLSPEKKEQLEAAVMSNDTAAMRKLMADPEISQALEDESKQVEHREDVIKENDKVRGDIELYSYLIQTEEYGIETIDDAKAYVATLEDDDLTAIKGDYAVSKHSKEERIGTELDSRVSTDDERLEFARAEIAKLAAESAAEADSKPKPKMDEAEKKDDSLQNVTQMFVKQEVLAKDDLGGVAAMFASVSDPKKAKEAIEQTKQIKAATEVVETKKAEAETATTSPTALAKNTQTQKQEKAPENSEGGKAADQTAQPPTALVASNDSGISNGGPNV